MNKYLQRLILILCFWICSKQAFAGTNATNFYISNLKCTSLQLNWTNGSGKARIIIGTEGTSAPGFKPANNTSYVAYPYFNLVGKSATVYSPKSYVVYNANGTNYVVIDSLKPCTNYTFTIYEHDNNGASTQYDTANAISTSGTTYCLNYKLLVNAIDSCEAKNKFEFTNQSTSTIPGISYALYYGDAYSDVAPVNNKLTHSYSGINGNIYASLSASPSYGCSNLDVAKIRIYPKKVAKLDSSKLINHQCLNGNLFQSDITMLVTPLPKSITYHWNFGDGETGTFKRMYHQFKTAGQFNIWVELRTNVNLKPTSCADTLHFIAYVRKGPEAKVEIKDNVQCVTGHSFLCQSKLYYKTTNQWHFGDGTYDTSSVTYHQYGGVNTYHATHILIDSNLCTDTFNFTLVTLNSANSAFAGLDTAYCVKDTSIKLTSSTPYGNFYGYPIKNNMLKTDSVGTYQLKYAIRLKNCSDSTIKNFKIKSSCFPSLGANLIISSGQNITLDAGLADTYHWNTGDTTQTILVEGSKLTPGSHIFIVKASNKNGCFGIDTIIVGRDYFSNLKTLKNPNLQFYPNPVNSLLNIESQIATQFSWEIYNTEGQLLIRGNQATKTIDLSYLKNGLYILRFATGNCTESYKISKQ